MLCLHSFCSQHIQQQIFYSTEKLHLSLTTNAEKPNQTKKNPGFQGDWKETELVTWKEPLRQSLVLLVLVATNSSTTKGLLVTAAPEQGLHGGRSVIYKPSCAVLHNPQHPAFALNHTQAAVRECSPNIKRQWNNMQHYKPWFLPFSTSQPEMRMTSCRTLSGRCSRDISSCVSISSSPLIRSRMRMGGTGLVCRVIKLRNSDSRDSLPLSKRDFWHKTEEGQRSTGLL